MYYLVLVQNDSTPAIFGYSSYDEVLARYHTELAYRAEIEGIDLTVKH